MQTVVIDLTVRMAQRSSSEVRGTALGRLGRYQPDRHDRRV